MIQKMTIAEFAEYVFQNRDKTFQSLFYGDFDQETGEHGDAYVFAVMTFAGSPSVVVNYAGGGWMFCYEFGDEDDPSGFESALDEHLYPFGIRGHVWADTTFSLPFMVCGVDDRVKRTVVDKNGNVWLMRMPAKPSSNDVVVEVEGGCVTGVYATMEDTSVEILDHDCSDGEDALRDIEEHESEVRRRIESGELKPVL